jgi:hypothetical protein
MNVDLIVALVTLVGTLAVLIWNIIDRRRSAFDDQMSQATDFLTGKTQRRSAGIAIIEGAKERLKRQEGTWRTAMVGLLCTQAVYLLEWSEQGKRPDEILNLKRILKLLIVFKDQPSSQTEIADVGRRQLDLKSAEQRSRGLDRTEIKKMVNKSPEISGWVKAIPEEHSQLG